MTYTNEQIEEAAKTYESYGEPIAPAMLRAWIAERKKMVVTDEVVKLFRILDCADGGEWRWSENGNIITDQPKDGDDPEIAAVYTEHEDDSEPVNSMAICAAINFLRKNRSALEAALKEMQK